MRAPSATANSGATVALAITTPPGFIAATAPCSPNSTVSVCAALTTSVTTTSHCAPSSAGVAGEAAFGGERLQHGVAHIACVHAQAGAQQRAGDAEAHRAEADDSNIS